MSSEELEEILIKLYKLSKQLPQVSEHIFKIIEAIDNELHKKSLN